MNTSPLSSSTTVLHSPAWQTRRMHRRMTAGLLVGLLLVMLLALGSGRYPLGWSDLPRLLGSPSELDRLVAWDLRLPRILAACSPVPVWPVPAGFSSGCRAMRWPAPTSSG